MCRGLFGREGRGEHGGAEGNDGGGGLSFGRKYYGGTGLVGKKRRPQFHVAVASVATDIGSVEKIGVHDHGDRGTKVTMLGPGRFTS
uniref:Uncharacterized protein n=1 Tax=Salix viminalis TaxID=40686 RepID=A0A6N2LBF5_SALVM